MENAVEALKIAAAVLVFIIAIASSFSLFGTAKHTADSIIGMRDKQAYLDAAEVDNGILYTSTDAISNARTLELQKKLGVNEKGDRIVKVEDVVSTIYRYSKEKYGVTIIDYTSHEVLARYDSNTDNVMSKWHLITDDQKKEDYAKKIAERISTTYVESVSLNAGKLENIYKIKIEGNSNIKCGAPWYGNEEEIQKRILCDLKGKEYIKNNQTYQGKNLISLLSVNVEKIIEVTNEIDQSIYLKDTDDTGNEINTNLLQGDGYEMPTVEIVYIVIRN